MSAKDPSRPLPDDREIAGLRAGWVPLDPQHPAGLGLYVPRSSDEVLEQAGPEAYGPEERLPYFGSLWPAGRSLAAHVLRAQLPPVEHALTIGCGVGAAGLAALSRGIAVSFLDWEPRALTFVAASADAQRLKPARLLSGSWSAEVAGAPYPWVLGADLVYEARNVESLLAALPELVAPGGALWLADPGRAGFVPLVEGLVEGGFGLDAREDLPPVEHRAEVRLARLRRVGSSR